MEIVNRVFNYEANFGTAVSAVNSFTQMFYNVCEKNGYILWFW